MPRNPSEPHSHSGTPREEIVALEALVVAAEAARRRAYAPYSRFAVGAALLAESGEIFTGCNVENASYGATLCAERVAAATAIAAGSSKWRAIAIVTSGGGPPCGICRQFLAEFHPTLTIVLADADRGHADTKSQQVVSLGDLLPARFSAHDLRT